MKMNLKGFDLLELRNFVESLGEKKYRAGQLFSWLYAKGVQSFDEMSDISKRIPRDTETICIDLQSSNSRKKHFFGWNDKISFSARRRSGR